MTPRASWLDSVQLERVEGGSAALAALAELSAATRDEIVRAGESISGRSLAAAQAFVVRAPRAWATLGAENVRDWVATGLAVGDRLDGRDALAAWFRFDPARLATLSRANRDHWLDRCEEVARKSRRLSVTCLTVGGGLLIDAAVSRSRFDVWVEAGLELLSDSGWRGEFLAQTYFAAGDEVAPVLSGEELRAWVSLGVGAQVGRDVVVGFFEHLPPGFAALPQGARTAILAICGGVAKAAPCDAAGLFEALPSAVAELSSSVRHALLGALRRASTGAAELIALVPWLTPIVRAIPEPHREILLHRVATLGKHVPEGVVPLLRSLPRALSESSPEGVEQWIAEGARVAARHPAAADAYFRLESGTSLHVLRETTSAARFDEVRGTLRSYARMLGAAAYDLHSAEGLSLRPFLNGESLDQVTIVLPDRMALFDVWEENFALLRVMTANAVGRRLFGTFDLSLARVEARLPAEIAEVLERSVGGDDLAALLEAVPGADPLIPLFAACEGARIDTCLRQRFRGYAADLKTLAVDLRRHARRTVLRPELVLFLVGAGVPAGRLAARDLPTEVLGEVVSVLTSPYASVEDSLATAILLRERLEASLVASGVGTPTTYDELMFEQMTGETLDADPADDAPWSETGGANAIVDIDPALVEETEEDGRGTPLSAQELKELLEAGAIVKVGKGAPESESAGIYATGLESALSRTEEPGASGGVVDGVVARKPVRPEGFVYDEWDFEIRDYRPAWCYLEEVHLSGDAGEFFTETLSRYSDLLPEVRRQFQRIRPDRYRRVRRLEDGEDFDLNAVIEAHVDRKARRPPSSRLYVARRREERDVATLFLLDMSASTDETIAIPEGSAAARRAGGRPRRIIDINKEALVIMAEALNELGDRYAIYGFSGQGRDNVELYPVKHFNDGLGPGVRGRIGGIEPRRSTRMGTVLRHAISKMINVTARSKHLLLLSDGFPQDFDYGNDRCSNTYGIQDTMMALQECQAAGIQPFCITVDKTGHDYLRKMCETSRYLVIEDVESLPAELPKIYERWIQA